MLAYVLFSWANAAEVNMHWTGESIGLATVAGSYFLLNTIEPRPGNLIANPGTFDSLVHPQWNPEISNFSDFMGHPLKLYGMNAPVLSTVGIGIFAGITQSPQDGLAHSLIVSESIAITVLITEALKLSIARPRPFTSEQFQHTYPDAYQGPFVQHEIESRDAYKSFPSGHTSSAAATFFSTATLLAHSTDNNLWKGASYGSAAVLTGLAGWARVRYGVHHPTDVIAGALLGGCVGATVAWFHIEK